MDPASRCKKVGTDFSLWPITSEDFKPLTQRIGPASRFKAALRFPTTTTEADFAGRPGRAGWGSPRPSPFQDPAARLPRAVSLPIDPPRRSSLAAAT
jgi:hypothetical protein